MAQRHLQFWPQDVPRHIDVPRTSVHYNLEVTARRFPEKAAIIFYDSPLAYAGLWQQAQSVAGFLRHRCGVKRGDRVLLFMQNSPQFVASFYGILAADAMVVPVNPMNLADELRHYATNADATTILCGQELYPQVRPLLADKSLTHAIVAAYSDAIAVPTDLTLPDSVKAPRAAIDEPGVTLWCDVMAASLAPGLSEAGPDDLCVMPYTSGTTGLPKGCVHTHATVMNTLVAGGAWFRQGQGSVLLATLPFFHVTGMQGAMNGPIYMGSTVILMQRWDRTTAARLIERYQVASWTAISTMVIDFLANPDIANHDLSSLRQMSGGGAAMPEAVAKRMKELTGLDYVEGYGLSETIAPTHINPPDRPKKQCLGIPIFGTEARVVDPDTFRELAPTEVGEIVVCGGQVFKGYWKAPEATAAAFVELDGQPFFRTGDLGYVDDDGYYFIVDRLKRMINAAGFKVWPAEVEAMMYGHPDIQEACIISTPDATRGETVKAMVVLKAARKGAVTADDIIDWARLHMAAYKIPRSIEFVDTLPKSATGKVQWRQLQDQEWRR